MSFRPRSQAATFPFHASNTSFDNRTGKFNGHKTAMSLTALMLAFFSTAFLSPTSAQEKTAKPSSEAVEESFKTVDSLKVTKILFYSSGVAQIIHAGQISGNIEIELGFAANDIDDALKSLVLEDPDGDSQVVVYPTAPSAEQMAADEFADPLTLAQTFQLFRGEELCFKYNDAERTGTIYVVENRQQDDVVVETLVILSESGLQAYPVAELSEIRFMDDATSKKFRDALTGLRLDRNPTDIKKVFLQFKGKGKRDVRYSYLIDGPIWRITYRLMLEGEKANLQSWVHLDNIFGYDWEDVEVELRNGQPDAFHVDLFAPIVAQRRDAGLSAFELPKNVSLVSRWYELSSPLRFGGGQQPDDSDKGAGGAMGGMGGGGTFGGGGGMGGMGGGFGGGAGLGRGGGLGGASGGNEPATGSGGTGRVRPLLGTDQNPERLLDPRQVAIAGDSQFQIHGAVVLKLKNRVSLSAGSSAVVPVFVQEFPVRKLTRVSFADAPKKEVATLIGGSATQIGGLQLEINNVGKTPLLTGPIAIFEQGSFIGDGLLKRTFSNEKLLVDYGADLETVVSQAYTEPITGPVEITLEERTIKVRLETRQTLTLDITNQHPEPRTLRLKLPDSLQDESRWTRLEPPLDFVDGETEMEFEVPAQETLARKHILILEEFETFNPAEAVPQYKTWKNLKLKIPPDVKKLLEETVEAHRRYREKQELVQALKDTARALELEQIRLSRLVEIAKSDPELAKTFLNSIRDAEKEMIETRKKIKLEEVQLRKLEVEWKTYS